MLGDDLVQAQKEAFIREHHLVVWRFHDLWHLRNPDGILEGVTAELDWQKFQNPAEPHLFKLPPATLANLEASLKQKLGATTPFRTVGDPKMRLTNVALLPGASGELKQSSDARAQRRRRPRRRRSLRVGDRANTSATPSLRAATKPSSFSALEVSEEPGMEYCARWLQGLFPGIPVEFIKGRQPLHEPGSQRISAAEPPRECDTISGNTLILAMAKPPAPRKPLGSRQAELIATRKFFLLFLFLLGSLALYPYTEAGGARYYIFRFLGSGIVILSVYAVSFRRTLLLVAALLAVPAFLQKILVHEFDASAISLIRTALSLAFDVFIVVVIFRRVFSHEKPTAETVFGALCIYLLVGFSFASAYGLVANVQPHAFYLDPATNLHSLPDRFDFIYYSFGTMTALGTPGITPVSGEARSLSVIESILGILYLAVLISRLMAAYRNPTPPPIDQ